VASETNATKRSGRECQATSPPEFEIYQLEHADVLITPISKKKTGPVSAPDVVASARTVAAMKETPAREAVDQIFLTDPWASYQPSKHQKVATSSISDASKFEALAARVEKPVNQALAARPTGILGDEPMPAAHDQKVSELESRLKALESAVSRNHQEQQISMVVSNIVYFHPYWGKIPNLTNIFQMG